MADLVCLVLGIISGVIFLLRKNSRIDGWDIFVATIAAIGWPVYMISLGIMRIFNGDWR